MSSESNFTDLATPLQEASSLEQTREVARRFVDAFQQHDAGILADIIGEDCVMLNTGSAPTGVKYTGYEACLAVWQDIAASPEARFDIEEVFCAGERAIVRWLYSWGEDEGESFRGLNVLRIQNGRIVESFGYR